VSLANTNIYNCKASKLVPYHRFI